MKYEKLVAKSTENLMDSGEGGHLYSWQWHQIHNPPPAIPNVFQDASEGQVLGSSMITVTLQEVSGKTKKVMGYWKKYNLTQYYDGRGTLAYDFIFISDDLTDNETLIRLKNGLYFSARLSPEINNTDMIYSLGIPNEETTKWVDVEIDKFPKYCFKCELEKELLPSLGEAGIDALKKTSGIIIAGVGIYIAAQTGGLGSGILPAFMSGFGIAGATYGVVHQMTVITVELAEDDETAKEILSRLPKDFTDATIKLTLTYLDKEGKFHDEIEIITSIVNIRPNINVLKIIMPKNITEGMSKILKIDKVIIETKDIVKSSTNIIEKYKKLNDEDL